MFHSKLIATICCVFLFSTSSFAQELTHTQDSLKTVKENIAAKKAVLVDVREENEWEAGHLAGALHLAMSDLADKNRRVELAKKLDKDKIIYTYCKSGGRSLIAGGWLKEKGFDVRPLEAGFQELSENGFASEVKAKDR